MAIYAELKTDSDFKPIPPKWAAHEKCLSHYERVFFMYFRSINDYHKIFSCLQEKCIVCCNKLIS